MTNFIFSFLKSYCTLALNFYFRKWEIQGANHVPDVPVIFVPNHHNAFLDAILVTCSSKKNPWYLTRAKVFSSPSITAFLHKLQMLPIYRFRDGFDAMKKNNQVMEDVIRKLNRKESILIFSEGGYSERDILAPLQKGVAKIALSVLPEANVAIVPVGIRYESRTAFRTNVLVNFGMPIYVNAYASGADSESEKTDKLLTTLRNKLEPLMLHLGENEYQKKLEYIQANRQLKATLKDQLESDQALVKLYPNQISNNSREFKVSFSRKFFRLYSDLNNIISTFLIKSLILKKIKDLQFTGSVKFAAGLFIAPVFWILQSLLIGLLTQSLIIAAIYFLTIILAIKLS